MTTAISKRAGVGGFWGPFEWSGVAQMVIRCLVSLRICWCGEGQPRKVNRSSKGPQNWIWWDLHHLYSAVRLFWQSLQFEGVTSCVLHARTTTQCTLDTDFHCSMQPDIALGSQQHMLQESERPDESLNLCKSSRCHHDLRPQVAGEGSSWLDGRVNIVH